MEQKSRAQIKKFYIDNWNYEEDNVVSEIPFSIYINNNHFITLMSTPYKLEELAVGFLYAEKIIDKYEEIKEISLNNNIINIEIDKNILSYKFKDRVISSGCGKGSMHISMINHNSLDKIKFDGEFLCEDILNHMMNFNKNSKLFLETGGVHSCAISRGKDIIIFAEDIGRHNALDKVIGHALMHNIDITSMMLLTSGRISSDIIIKAARGKIPVIVSHSAPTDLAIKIAKSLNITLIGFVRGKRLNIYSNFERIK